MAFVPPRCPNPACSYHRDPVPGFFRRRGSYRPRCRSRPVPRFRCRGCSKSFSHQTFRQDRGDRRPECNAPLFTLVNSGVGLRQIGRCLQLDIHAVQRKHRKIGRTCQQLHEHVARSLPGGRTFLLDEEETYEGASIRPVTMPVLIEEESWFVVATGTGSIRRLAKAGTRRRERQDRAEAVHGPRPDQSNECVRNVLQQLADRVPEGPIILRSDQKSSYATIARAVLGDRVVHLTTPSTLIRDVHNPLFAINTTMAMTRDNCGRLRRRSWLVSKKKEYLQVQLHLFTVYRNYVRRRFNRDGPDQTAAWHLGLLPRALTAEEVVAWRQDWGALSIHPMSPGGAHTITEKLPIGA